jgi:four helix bundle protein
VLNRQILRSGTAIGALVSESRYAQSRADFVNKLKIAIKEANETRYWLSLLKDTDYISKQSCNSFKNDNLELIRLLTPIINTTQQTQ